MSDDATRRIVIVDDDAHASSILQRVLQREGYAVNAVGDGPRMWAAIERAKPSLIVVDAALDSGHGIELCRQIREHRPTRQTPVIVASIADTTALRHEAIQAGADNIIVKPYHPASVLDNVRLLIELSGLI